MKELIVLLVLSSGVILSQNSSAQAIDPEMIAKAYDENTANADLLYKGKVLTTTGVVTAITDDSAWGGVGRAYFASPSEENRLGGSGSLEWLVSDGRTHIWSCSFDANRVEEIAKLRRNDVVVLTGQLAGFLDFRHCRVVSQQPPPPKATSVSNVPEKVSKSALPDLLTQIGNDYGDNPVNAALVYRGKFLTVRGTVESIAGIIQFEGDPRANTWNCAYDRDSIAEIAKVRKGDVVVLRGQLVSFLNFHHCAVISDAPVN